MDPFLTLLLGLLTVAPFPGLIVIADLLGPTETRHISRHHIENQASREPTSTGRLS